jgi:hypothetical protein
VVPPAPGSGAGNILSFAVPNQSCGTAMTTIPETKKMQISASMVKELRERTGSGMMECKKALVEVDGDIDLAIENTIILSPICVGGSPTCPLWGLRRSRKGVCSHWGWR